MKTLVPPDISKQFAKAKVSDTELKAAIARAERGLVDARIGKFLIKQRIPREGEGRSKGFRTVVYYKIGSLAIFLHMFPKSKKSNLTSTESETFNDFASKISNLNDEQITCLAEKHGWRTIE